MRTSVKCFFAGAVLLLCCAVLAPWAKKLKQEPLAPVAQEEVMDSTPSLVSEVQVAEKATQPLAQSNSTTEAALNRISFSLKNSVKFSVK